MFKQLKPESNEMLHLDALRFIAAIAVVVRHWSDSIPHATGDAIRSRLLFLSLSVDLFFIISGVVMFRVYLDRMSTVRDYAKFMQRRIARLYPLHLATLIIMLLFGLTCLHFHVPLGHPDRFNLHYFLPNLFLLQSLPFTLNLTFNFPSWSISAEMFCYLILPVGFYLFRRSKWAPAAIGLCGIIILTATTGDGWTEWSTYFGCVRAFPAFLFGITLGGSRKLLLRVPAPNVVFTVFGTLLLFLGIYAAPRGILLFLVYLIAISAYAADIQGATPRLISAIAPFGTLTYSIYMLHAVYQTLVFGPVQALLHPPVAILIGFILLSFIPLLIIATHCYFRFEMPARRWLSGVRSRERVAPNLTIPLSEAEHIRVAPVMTEEASLGEPS